jgi:hypothetical protein
MAFKSPQPPFVKGKVRKNGFLIVTPVETGVQAVLKYLKILDSGFRRNDGQEIKGIFSQLQGGEGGIFIDLG